MTQRLEQQHNEMVDDMRLHQYKVEIKPLIK